MREFPSVRVAFEHEATKLVQGAKGVTLSIATPSGATTVEADYVVACDGGASPTRERLGVRLVGSTYSERWLVVDANVKNHSVKQITFTCDPRRPRVELPAVGERVRWEFMQLPGESEETLKRDETIRALVQRRAAPFRSRSSARPSIPSMRASPKIGGAAASSSRATRRI